MSDSSQKQMADSLSRIEAVFAPGALADKLDAMQRLRQSGDTQFFTGGVRWAVLLEDFDKRIKGEAESLDSAFGDMANCLAHLAADHGEETPVLCSVEPAA